MGMLCSTEMAEYLSDLLRLRICLIKLSSLFYVDYMDSAKEVDRSEDLRG